MNELVLVFFALLSNDGSDEPAQMLRYTNFGFRGRPRSLALMDLSTWAFKGGVSSKRVL